MTNNEPLSGHLRNDVNADSTSDSADTAARPASGTASPLNADMQTSGAPLGAHAETDSSGTGDTDAVAASDTGPGSDQGDNLGSLGDPAHPFDQTNGIVEGLEGDSDEADGDEATPA